MTDKELYDFMDASIHVNAISLSDHIDQICIIINTYIGIKGLGRGMAGASYGEIAAEAGDETLREMVSAAIKRAMDLRGQIDRFIENIGIPV